MWAVRSSPYNISIQTQMWMKSLTHSGVSLLGGTGFSGEDDQSRSVLVQSLNVERLSLFALAPSSVVDNNSKSLGLLLSDTSELELGKGESSSL